MEKARRNGDLFWHPRFPNCIGWIYRELHDFEAARKFNEEGVDVARRHHVLEAEANSLINRGIDCTQAGQHECTDAAFTRSEGHLRARCMVSLALQHSFAGRDGDALTCARVISTKRASTSRGSKRPRVNTKFTNTSPWQISCWRSC